MLELFQSHSESCASCALVFLATQPAEISFYSDFFPLLHYFGYTDYLHLMLLNRVELAVYYSQPPP